MHSNIKQLHHLKALVSALTFFAALSFVYTYVISANWGYSGLHYEFRWSALGFSLAIVTIAVFLIPRKFSTRSFHLTLALYVLHIPSLVFFALSGQSFLYAFIVALSFPLIAAFSSLRINHIQILELSKKSLFIGLFGITAILIAALAGFGGFSSFNLDIFSVYEFRRNAHANLPAIFIFLIFPVSKAVIPAGIAIALYYRSPLAICAFILLATILFGLTHLKSILFIPFVVLVLYHATKKQENLATIFYLFFAAVLLAIFEYIINAVITDNATYGVFTDVVIRRLFFIPPLMDSYHVSFFSENEKFYWATSRLTFGLVDTHYHVTAPSLIGEVFFGRSDMSANSGLIASGYAQAGIFGIVLYSSFLGIIIAVLDSYGKHKGHPLVIATSFVLITTALNSSDLLVAFLTHGLLLLIFLLSAFPHIEHPRLTGQPQ
mgnify:CR=1 FL=1